MFTLLVEIPFTFLLILPFQFTRQVGAILQALLQIFILFTGNYNFFNLLTLVLLIPVWYSDYQEEGEIVDNSIRNTYQDKQKKSNGNSLIILLNHLLLFIIIFLICIRKELDYYSINCHCYFFYNKFSCNV